MPFEESNPIIENGFNANANKICVEKKKIVSDPSRIRKKTRFYTGIVWYTATLKHRS